MQQNGNIAKIADGQPETSVPLSEIELKILNQLLEGASLEDVSQKTGYSDFVIAAVLKGIQKKTRSNNLIQATIELVKLGTLKV